MGPVNRVDGLLQFQKLSEDAIVPTYQTSGASGFDLCCLESVRIPVGETRLIPTGLACSIPSGTEMQIRPRSGHSLKYPAYVSNAPGTIDEDYRGEIKIIVTALAHPVVFKAGQRIAQGVIVPVRRPLIVEVDTLDKTERGSNGFGSTGS